MPTWCERGSMARVLFTRLVSTLPVPCYMRESSIARVLFSFHVRLGRHAGGRPRAACPGEDRPDLAGPVAARQPRHGYVPNHPQSGAPVAGRDLHRSRRSRARLPDHPRGGAGLPCQGSGHASAHGQNHSLRSGAQARPGTPCSARKSGTDSSSRRSPTRSAFSPGTPQPFWPSTRQPSISTGIPRRNSCGEASSTSTSPSPSKLPQLGWRRMTGGRRYAPDTAARAGATWMWR